MSERKWLYVWMLLAYIAGSVTSGALYLRGKQVGRAEQKRWDDAWYQAHPVVDYSQCPANMVKCSNGGSVIYLPPTPPKKAKPAKARPCNQIGFTHTNCDYAQTPLDLPAKEIINEHAFGNTKPCDPPLPADSMISCFEWVPVHEGWTCEDKQRILQQSEDGKLHCILPAPKP